MTDMQRHFEDARRGAAGHRLPEHALLIAVLVIVGVIALAELSGAFGTLVHGISFAA